MTAESASQADPQAPTPSEVNPSAWLEQYGDGLYRYARARVASRELAEDLVQETLLAALRSQDRFANRSSVRTWLFSILRHKIVDHYRGIVAAWADTEDRSTRDFTADGLWSQAPSPWKSPETALMDQEFRNVLDGCIGALPPSLAQAFVLRELEQIEIADLSKTLGLTAGNLRVRLYRARMLLRECLETRWFETRSDESPRVP